MRVQLVSPLILLVRTLLTETFEEVFWFVGRHRDRRCVSLCVCVIVVVVERK